MKRLMNVMERRAWTMFAVLVAGALLIGWLTYASTRRLHHDQDAVAESYQTLQALEAALSSLQKVESGERGYLLTGNPEFLESYNAGSEEAGRDLARLKTLTAGDPVQTEQLASLEALAAEKIDFARRAIAIKDGEGGVASERFVAAGRGKALMDGARAAAAAMERSEEDRLRARTSASDVIVRNTTILTGALAALSLALVAILLVAILRALASARRAAEAIARLGAIVEASNDAIVSLDIEGCIVSWNPGAERLFGYTAAETLHQHVSLIVPPEQAGEFRSISTSVLQGKHVMNQDTVRLARGGRRIDVSLSVFPIYDAAGAPAGGGAVLRDMTERKRAENALRDSERRWATIFNHSPAGISITRASDGVLLEVNARLLEMFGVARDEVIGRTSLDLGIWADPARRATVAETLAAEGSLRDVEIQWRTLAGRTLDTISSWDRLDLGDMPCILTLISDITQRKQAENALRESQRRWATIFHASPVALAITHPADFVFLDVNQRYLDLMGFSREEVIGQTAASLGVFDDLLQRAAAIERLSFETPIHDVEVQFRSRSGRPIDALLSVEPVELDGQTRLLSAISDITARKEAERDRERIFLLSSDLIAIADFDGVFRRVNPAIEKLGYSEEEIIHRPFLDLLHPDDRDAASGMIKHLAAGERALTFEGRLRAKDGSYRWVELAASADLDNGVVYSVARDVTVRKQMEAELREAKEAAEEANRAKSAFLSRMSHELRTPLNVILGFGQVLQLDPLEPQQNEAVDYILKAGRHLLELIDEVLDISRIEAGRLSLSLEPVRTSEILGDVLILMRPLASQRRIAINADLDACDRFIIADRQRLRQALLNLLANAIKYNRDGGAVDVTCAEAADSALRISVADTGPGIAPEKMARLFVPFDRLGAESTDVEGTGLGLTLSRYLVEAMGGSIGVESIVDAGSTFWIELPLTEAPAHAPEEVSNEFIEFIHQPRLTGQRTVLYIEDNLANLNLMERILVGRLGFRLLSAMQGSLGLDLAGKHHPDVILLDLHLPDMSGNDVLRRLQDNPATRGIPVVVVSADATSRQVSRLREAGARAYITKPFDLKELFEMFDSLFQEAD